jgi:FSR family fosmidomycin resistance protein-like MFS transporter
MMFTMSGLVNLSFAQTYEMILISVALIGVGSSIFHPEATRMARYAAGKRQGLAQGIFQVGGQGWWGTWSSICCSDYSSMGAT